MTRKDYVAIARPVNDYGVRLFDEYEQNEYADHEAAEEYAITDRASNIEVIRFAKVPRTEHLA